MLQLLILITFSQQTSTQPTKLQNFLFHKLPDVAIPHSYAHYRIPFPIKPLLTSIDIAIEDFKKQHHGSQKYELAKITDRIYQDGIHNLQKLRKRTTDLIARLPLVQRSKRFIGLISAFTGAAALGMAFYNAHSISRLNDHIQALGDKHNQLVDITHVHQKHLEKLEIQFKQISGYWVSYFDNNPTLVQNHVNAIILEIQEKVDLLNNLLEHGIRNQLAHNIFPTEVLQNITNHVTRRSDNISAISPVKKPMDLLHMDCSYLFTNDESTLITIIHVPFFDKIFQAVQFQPLPLTYHNMENNKHIIPDVGPKSILATRPDHIFFLMSPQELKDCPLMGGIHVCKGRNVFQTNLANTCIGAIYLQNRQKVPQVCEFREDPNTEHIIKIRKNTFLVLTATELFTSMICKNKSPTGLTITNMMQLEVPGDCSVLIHDQVIAGDSDDYLENEDPLHIQWDVPLTEVIPTISIPKSLNDTINELDELQRNLTSVKGWEKLSTGGAILHDPVNGALVVAVITTVIGILALGLYNWYRLRKQRAIRNGPPIVEPLKPIYTRQIPTPLPKTMQHQAEQTVYPDLTTVS